jgi:hypothetical protein
MVAGRVDTVGLFLLHRLAAPTMYPIHASEAVPFDLAFEPTFSCVANTYRVPILMPPASSWRPGQDPSEVGTDTSRGVG